MSTGNLFKTYWQLKTFNFKENLCSIKRYYKNYRFCLIDLLLNLIYLFINPYRVSKKFLKRKNFKNIHIYGETPLTSFEKIIKRCDVKPSQKLLELGSGRGRCAFWLSENIRCQVDAIEWIPTFHNIAFFVSRLLKSKNLNFFCQDMFYLDFSDYDFIFLYGTCLEDSEILSLIEKFKKMKRDSKIITISYSLNEYDPSFLVIDEFSLSFPWGKAFCFINQKKEVF